MIKCESGITFRFEDQYSDVLKYDDTAFYREMFQKQPSAKAVDFLASSDDRFILLEVKNCSGNESENRWRVFPNNGKKETNALVSRDVMGRESLDIEVAEKVAMTLAALSGVYTRPKPESKAAPCMVFAESLFDKLTHEGKRKIIVIAVIDGEFGCFTRSNQMIWKSIRESIEKKLKWLNARVIVTDSGSLREWGIGIHAIDSDTERQ